MGTGCRLRTVRGNQRIARFTEDFVTFCRVARANGDETPRLSEGRPKSRGMSKGGEPTYFSMTQVVMHRMFCTLVVLSGSASVPPSLDVHASSVGSSTTKRSEPSGSRTRPVADER